MDYKVILSDFFIADLTDKVGCLLSSRSKITGNTMKRFKRLGVFTLLVLLALAALYFGIQAFLERQTARFMAQQEIVDEERAAIAVNLFYSHYHVWPCAAGPLSDDATTELGGFDAAKINTEHINFFKKANCDMLLLDRNGRELFFKTDDRTGTCTVYSESEAAK